MIIPLTPVPKPRMTQSDRWRKRPAVLRYFAFCDKLREEYPIEVPSELALRFNIPMPPSWSRAKKESMIGKGHQQRPDVDNLGKAFLDALCKDDSYVYAIRIEKYWAEKGSIEVSEY